jgi:chromosome segregation protein
MKLEFVEIAGFRGFREKTMFELAPGFTVLAGRNGAGKSTVLDAIDFALTGTLNRFSVKGARGGGLDEHIWWVGSGKAVAHYVSVGFIDEGGKRFEITRSRERGCNTEDDEMLKLLCKTELTEVTSLETLMQTTLIRDELIAALSLDLPEQARFATVRAAIGGMAGPDYSARTAAILSAANIEKNKHAERSRESERELGNLLTDLTEARSIAERSADVADALRVIESLPITVPNDLAERVAEVRRFVAERRMAIRAIEEARLLAEQVVKERTVFSSDAQAEIDVARLAREKAFRENRYAQERMDLAARLDAAEKEKDEFAARLAAILEHGAAVGLQDGHCPLCNSVVSVADFEMAIASARTRLAIRGQELAASSSALTRARSTQSAAEKALATAEAHYAELEGRRVVIEHKLASVREIYSRYGFDAPPDDPKRAEELIFAEEERAVGVERALATLETSIAIDRVKALEVRIASLRARSELEAARLSAASRAVEAAHQIDTAARTVANQILTEQFGIVMPLLKELYKRLRPHAEWSEIESDFGGKVRGSLNFLVAGGHNPQFLFSSGQRRAAGLAFLLAVHMSRPWCRWRSLLLDDPVQHIDDYRALNLVEVLTAIRRTGQQVLVAVEDTALANLLSRRLRSASGDLGRLFELGMSKTGTAQIESEREVYPMPRSVLRSAQAS